MGIKRFGHFEFEMKRYSFIQRAEMRYRVLQGKLKGNRCRLECTSVIKTPVSLLKSNRRH